MHKILVVEDEPNLLELYKTELAEEGYQVIGVKDGETAIAETKRILPHLVVLDIKINKVPGLDVLQEIKNFNRNLPVILNSAYETYKSDFSSWMADAYIIKSSNLNELKQKIKELLNI
jgi:DNA-binding response OmpR family regulator